MSTELSPLVRTLFRIDYARKTFLHLYQKQENSKRTGQHFVGLTLNDWASESSTMYGMTRSLFIEYIAVMEKLGLVAQDSSRTRFTVTEAGYKAASSLEAEKRLDSIEREL